MTSKQATPLAPRRKWRMLVLLPLWVGVSFFAAQIGVVAFVESLRALGAPIALGDDVLAGTVLAAAVYTSTLVIVVGVPWLIRRSITSKEILGLTRLPSWLDILLTPAAAFVYLLLSASFILIAGAVFPQIDLQQAQDVGFYNLATRSQYMLAFLTLIVLAPLAEEVLFRGYLYGKLRTHVPLWAALMMTSLLFAAAHMQWNVAVDTFALSLVLCSLREITGSIWAGVLLHMVKNGVAFYFIFINPSLLSTLGG